MGLQILQSPLRLNKESVGFWYGIICSEEKYKRKPGNDKEIL